MNVIDVSRATARVTNKPANVSPRPDIAVDQATAHIASAAALADALLETLEPVCADPRCTWNVRRAVTLISLQLDELGRAQMALELQQ